MEPSLTLIAAEPPRVRIVFARLLQTIGWAGISGLALLVAAAAIAQAVWTKRGELAVSLATMPSPSSATRTAVGPVPQQPLLKLPTRSDVPLLLTRIERAVTESGLPWTSGDYRLIPASDRQVAALEVRCAFKAPYPKLRAMLTQVIGSVPAVTFREMSFSRANVDSADVDARLAIVVFLADDAGSAQPVSSER